MLVKNLHAQLDTLDQKEAPENLEVEKPPSKKRVKKRYVFGSILGILLIALITYFAIVYKQDSITPKQHLKQVAGKSIIKTAQVITPTKKEKRYVSTLIMGIDTRGVEYNGEEYIPEKWNGTRKIDVIMQIVYDREKQQATYISIPRDTSLPVNEECMHQEFEDQKYINRIYDMAEKNDCPESGVEMMKKYVSYITGFGVDYYAIITLDAFVELIDIVGEENNGKKGIWIDVPRDISDYCPNKTYGYDYVFFPEGRQFLTSEEALCFVRVRKTSNDFDRNKRQQILMTEIGNRITHSQTLSDPMTMYEIYQSFQGKIQMSPISLKDVALGIEILSEIDLEDVQRVVLDYEFGGTNALLTKPLYSPPGTHTRSGYYLIPTAWDQSCCQEDEWKLVRKYLHEVMDNPDSQIDQAAIFAYVNSYTGGNAVFNNSKYQDFTKISGDYYIFAKESKYAQAMLPDGPDIQIFDFSGGQKAHIAEKIAQLSGGVVYEGSQAPFQPLNNEEITIVVRVN